ncbi:MULTISPECIES: N-acetyl-alpha-D-glucosaminyl L-malate synthase BshA [Exiguobacterium]|uniref:N-acetyl-alpha-D-glucosaminyl L-malate synthase BshA n=1 Tax=Exiguobacterium TaxID=33986 RepID=UPI001BE89E88|nr:MULTISPECIES: N-acetyl-alpha-D-glucosaminyl L-malate synthase BshA [Exiguobacterium]MCT4790773.1 N-acetyl-alpha-D-glucosaminyl L-malate synthase BshA [Exiguobacterium artemiae]
MKKAIGILCYPSVGGSGVVATELGMKLADRGHDVHFITSSIPFRLTEYRPNITVHLVEVNQYSVFKYPPYDITLASKVAEVIDLFDLDIIHAHYAVPHAVCAELGRNMAKKKGVGVVTTLHGTDITVIGQDLEMQPAIRYGIESSDAVTAVSESLALETNITLNGQYAIEVIPNSIDESMYYPMRDERLKRHYGIEPDEIVVIHISNFRPVKRIDDTIAAFAIASKDRAMRLLLVGDGPEMGQTRRRAKELGIYEKIIFAGKQEHVAQLLAISDIHLLLSEKEAFGLVVLEAMAVGVPSVVSSAGGLPEVIQDGKTGFIVPTYDVKTAADRIGKLADDAALREELAEEGIRDTRRRFDSNQVVRAYELLYERVCAQYENA